MTTSEQALGVLMLDLEGLKLTSAEHELLSREVVGGVILFSRNFSCVEQLRDLVGAIRACRSDLLIAVDQEGGRVQRFRDGFLDLPPLHRLGELAETSMADAQHAAKLCGWAMAAELLQHGIDFSFAPVLDLYNPVSRVIGDRAFSDQPSVVISLAQQYTAGMNAAGMAATGKHFPGHGTVAADSHLELPTDNRSWEALQDDFEAFAGTINSVQGIMPAHVVYPAVDDVCAGYSKIWIRDKLRQQLGFDGVVFSDDLTMAAAHSAGSVEQRAELALQAGCDMVLLCNDREQALSLAAWLEDQAYPASSRLSKMRAAPCEAIADLYNSAQWTEAKALVESLSTA